MRITAATILAVLAISALTARAGEPTGAGAPIQTLEDVFARYAPGSPWPPGCGVRYGGDLFCGPEDGALSTPGSGLTLTGFVDGFEVSAYSDPIDATVKAVYARRDDAFPAGDRAQATVAFRRLEAIFDALVRASRCDPRRTVEAEEVSGATRSFGARRLRCHDGAMELEAYVDLGERTVAGGREQVTPGRMGISARVRR